MRTGTSALKLLVMASTVSASVAARGQSIDRTTAPNAVNAGIAKSIGQEIGAGRGDTQTPDSSALIIARDPFRAIRRGRQLFQRKFTVADGVGPRVGDGSGDINTTLAIGAGLADSCAACHGRPRGAAGFGGDVATRPDSRDAPHLFGLGLKEMLADEITQDLRTIRDLTVLEAAQRGRTVRKVLVSKGINYGSISADASGRVDTSRVVGVDADLRVRPFFAHGGTVSIREFVVGALQNEMGLQAVDPELMAAAHGGRMVTPAGMVLDGAKDTVEGPPTDDPHADPDRDGVAGEVPTSLVDYLEFYLLNYFRPGTYEDTDVTRAGAKIFRQTGCAGCHIADLPIRRDRRVADVKTAFDPVRGNFNTLFATATPLHGDVDDGSGLPHLEPAALGPFLVEGIYSDLKRHDVGPGFYERNYDGTLRREFLTTPLWGVGTTAPYGHDGRSISLQEVILRHGGEATAARDAFAALTAGEKAQMLAFLNRLILFPPDDTASNLDPGDRTDAGYPQSAHGSIKLTVLFNNPADPE
jgi:mono/diheme cytochrome c family protein